MFFESFNDQDSLDEVENYSEEVDSEEERRHAEVDLYCQLHFESINDDQNEYSIIDFGSDDKMNFQISNSFSTPNVINIKARKKNRRLKLKKKAKNTLFSNVRPMTNNDLTDSSRMDSSLSSSLCDTSIVVQDKDKNSGGKNIVLSAKNVSKEKCLKEILENYDLSSDIDELTDILKSSEDSGDNKNDYSCTRGDISDEDDSSIIDISDDDDNCGKNNSGKLVTNIDTNSANSSQIEKMLDGILRSLPIKGNWSICDADNSKIFSSGSRYFENNCKPSCKNCDEKGHRANRCPYPKKLLPCIFCTKKHRPGKCPQQICSRCDQPGHSSRMCRIGWPSFKCPRCGKKGHHERLCPDKWRQYHLTTCEGIIKKHDSIQNKKSSNKNRYCYNCSSIDHFGYKCNKEAGDQFLYFISPFIYKYDDYYDKMSKYNYTTATKNNSQKLSFKDNSSIVKENFGSNSKQNFSQNVAVDASYKSKNPINNITNYISMNKNKEVNKSFDKLNNTLIDISQDIYTTNKSQNLHKNIFKKNNTQNSKKNFMNEHVDEKIKLKDKIGKRNKQTDVPYSKRVRRRKRNKKLREDFVEEFIDYSNNEGQSFKKLRFKDTKVKFFKSFSNNSEQGISKLDDKSFFTNDVSVFHKNDLKYNKSILSSKGVIDSGTSVNGNSIRIMTINKGSKKLNKPALYKNKKDYDLFLQNGCDIRYGKSFNSKYCKNSKSS